MSDDLFEKRRQKIEAAMPEPEGDTSVERADAIVVSIMGQVCALVVGSDGARVLLMPAPSIDRPGLAMVDGAIIVTAEDAIRLGEALVRVGKRLAGAAPVPAKCALGCGADAAAPGQPCGDCAWRNGR